MRPSKRAIALPLMILALFASACGGSDETASAVADSVASPIATTAPVEAATADSEPETAALPTSEPTPEEEPTADTVAEVSVPATAALSCADTAALFVTKGSVNPSLAEPQVNGSCIGDVITITANGIPDYTYIETSPGDPREQNLTFVMPYTPTATTEYTDVPAIGPIGVAINGVPIYGPTEGQGGDVLAGDALSECGSHNGPGGFHIHLFGTSTTTDCIYSPEEAAQSPQLFGYAVDGYPIYTGNDQYTSSWVLTNDTLFATDTWSAHSYVEGSGDLDQCNGRTDENGNYAYYTTETFPYVIGCFAGEVDLEGSGAGGGGGRGEAPAGDAEGAAPPEGSGQADDRAAPPEGGGQGAGGGQGEPPPGDAEGAAPPEGGGQAEGGAPAGGRADLTEAAAALGVSVEELEAALGTRPPDFEAAAATLGITVEELEAALPAPPG